TSFELISRIQRRQDDASTRPETYADKPLARTVARQSDFVAIFEEGTRCLVRKLQRVAAFPGQFEKTSAIFLLGPRYSAASNQIAGSQRTPVRGVMRHHLSQRPVHVFERPAADPYGLFCSGRPQP